MQADMIIVGQGIAGSVLALTLLGQGKQVLIYDEEQPFTASKVAGGMWNPLVFRREMPSWRIGEQYPTLHRFYQQAEQLLNARFYYPIPIWKLYGSAEERERWELIRHRPDLEPYLEPGIRTEAPEQVDISEGAMALRHSGYIDTNVFLQAARNYFLQRQLLIPEKLNPSAIEITDTGVRYQSHSAARVIFCDGFSATQNPWFSWLPFRPTKGEVLTVRIPGLSINYILNRGVFLLPLGNDLFRTGATYNWDDLTDTPTDKGREEILQKLYNYIRVPVEVTEHIAGVRPTVADRRPLMGLHPEYNSIGIFNGMGSKGVMYAPLLAEQFAAYLADPSHGLYPEADIQRFRKRLQKANQD